MRVTQQPARSEGSFLALDGDAARDHIGLRPYRHLAVRVLVQALLDVAKPTASAADRESARAFLAGSPMLFHWCHVAAIEPVWFAERASRGAPIRPAGLE
jgi:hypothetical protein